MSGGLGRFEVDGPFEVSERKDVMMSISAYERREVDVYQTRALGRSPVVVITHGNYSGKSAHADQARRLASWGFHVVVLELPNRDQWIENGRRIFELTHFLRAWPRFLGDGADSKRIILVGHSFGGSAVTLAAAQGAPVVGVILLDPAVVHTSVEFAMTRISQSAVLLGADTRIFNARNRNSFRKRWGGEFVEIAVVNATHDDAQGPSMFSKFALGVDPFTDNSQRRTFVSAIVSASISLANAGNLEHFSRDVGQSLKQGKIGVLSNNRKSL